MKDNVMSYNGKYLEDLIKEGNKIMIKKLINKSKEVRRKLLNDNEIHQLKDEVEDALVHLHKINPYRYKSAQKHMTLPSTKNKLDLFLAIDDILVDNKNNIWVGIDWTTNKNLTDLSKKINNHKDLNECHWFVGLDKSIVVLVLNEDTIPENKASKFVYRALKLIVKEVKKPTFQGGMTIDAKELMK